MDTTITTTSADHLDPRLLVPPPRRVVASVSASPALAAVTLTGCSGIATPRRARSAPSRCSSATSTPTADAPPSADSTDVAWFLPDWVPDRRDRHVDVRLDTQEPGYETLVHVGDRPRPRSLCTPVEGDLGGPALDPHVLPSTLPTSGLLSCGDGRVVAEVDGRGPAGRPSSRARRRRQLDAAPRPRHAARPALEDHVPPPTAPPVPPAVPPTRPPEARPRRPPRHVTKSFGQGDGRVDALRDVSLDLRPVSSPPSWARAARASRP